MLLLVIMHNYIPFNVLDNAGLFARYVTAHVPLQIHGILLLHSATYVTFLLFSFCVPYIWTVLLSPPSVSRTRLYYIRLYATLLFLRKILCSYYLSLP